jgi:hypothetical protein
MNVSENNIVQCIENEKVSEFQLNLMTLDTEQFAIPEDEPDANVMMYSGEFSRICREMSQINDASKLFHLFFTFKLILNALNSM